MVYARTQKLSCNGTLVADQAIRISCLYGWQRKSESRISTDFNFRFAPESGPLRDRLVNFRFVPKADVMIGVVDTGR